MNGMDSQKRDAIARKAWCQAIVKLPSAYVTSRDIAKLLNVCKTKSIQILKAAGGVKIGDVLQVRIHGAQSAGGGNGLLESGVDALI